MDFLIGFLKGRASTTDLALGIASCTIAGLTTGTTVGSGIDSKGGTIADLIRSSTMGSATDIGVERTSEVEVDASMIGEER